MSSTRAQKKELSCWEGEGGKPEILKPEEELKKQTLTEVPREMNECEKSLKDLSIKSIVSNREYIKKDPTREYIGVELITVWGTDTLHDVIQTMAKHRISSVPVLERAGDNAPGIFRGFLDMLDVASYIVSCAPAPFEKMQGEEMQKLGNEILNAPAIRAVDISCRYPPQALCEDHSVLEALELFAQGYHRIPLFDSKKRLVGLCSQSDVIQHMNSQFQKGVAMGMATRSLKDYGCMQWGPEHKILSVLPSATLQQAISKMAMAGLRTLAVLSPTDGTLIGCLCANDIAKVFHETINPRQLLVRLSLTVEAFLEGYSPELMKPLFELANVSLSSVCKQLSDTRSHHLWIVDSLETMHPVALCTLTDVCRVLSTFKGSKWLPAQ